MQIFKRLPNETTREYAYRVIKLNIISLDLKPGSMVSESKLASKLGVSRTPVREALMQLSKSDIVEIYPQKGSRVSLIDEELVDESRYLRLVLEKAMVELICSSENNFDLLPIEENISLQKFYLKVNLPKKILELDNEFHRLLFIVTNNEKTYNIFQIMASHFDRIRNLSVSSERDSNIVNDHIQFYKALKKKNQKEAIEILTKHLSRYKVDIVALRKEHPNYFK